VTAKNIITREQAIEAGIIEPKPGERKPQRSRAKDPAQRRHEAFVRFLAGLQDCWLVLEYQFHPERKWRFDVAIRGWWDGQRVAPFLLRPLKIAIEIDGRGPGHYSFKGRDADNVKANAAAQLGWSVYRFSWQHIMDGEALATIRGAIERAT